jgi:hypothetical protein
MTSDFVKLISESFMKLQRIAVTAVRLTGHAHEGLVRLVDFSVNIESASGRDTVD